MPLFGMALGAATGAATGALSDYGVDDNFMKQLAPQRLTEALTAAGQSSSTEASRRGPGDR